MGLLLSAIILENEGFSLNDLSLIQRMALKKAFTGKLDPNNVSEKEADILDSLVDLGLLDLGYDVTPDGERAGKLIDQYSRREREDLTAAKQLASEMEPRRGSDNYEDDYRFTEGENAIMKAAGLHEDDMRMLFTIQHKLAKLDEMGLGLPEVRTIQGSALKDLKDLEEVLNTYTKKNPGIRYIEELLDEVKEELNRREHGAEEEAEEEDEEDYRDEPEDQYSDMEADADTLASAGYGTDEDYGSFGGDDGGWY